MTAALKRPPQWRPLNRSLSDEAVHLMAEQRAAGHDTVDVHLALTKDIDPQPFRTACHPNGVPGEWITGRLEQVTCKACIEQVHA